MRHSLYISNFNYIRCGMTPAFIGGELLMHTPMQRKYATKVAHRPRGEQGKGAFPGSIARACAGEGCHSSFKKGRKYEQRIGKNVQSSVH